MKINCFRMGFGNGVDFRSVPEISCFKMGFGNGVDFLSTIPNKKWWTEEGFVDEGGEVVLKAMSQDGFLNRPWATPNLPK